MKIAVVGGAGAMAKAVIRDLIRSSDVSEVLIADINEVESQRFTAELRETEETRATIVTSRVDVFDHDRLVEVLTGYDAAIDTTHQDCGAQAAKGIIDAKVNGCALGSSHSVAQETLRYDGLAKDKGVTYLLSAGTFPGATGITARYLADRMDQADDVHLSMVIFRPIALTPALVDLFISFLPGEGLCYEDGALKKTPPFSGKEEVEYLEPFGKQTVYNITSLDPLTVPQAIKGVKNVHVKATYHPEYTEMLRTFHNVGLLSKAPVLVLGEEVVPADVLKELLLRRPVEPGKESVKFVQRVKVSGRRNGIDVEGTIETPFLPFEGERDDPETRATGEPGSIIVQMLARAPVEQKGVMGPESCIDPAAFIEEWSRRPGVQIRETWSETRTLYEEPSGPPANVGGPDTTRLQTKEDRK